MQTSPDPITRLIFELSKLPGIGEKTATRLAYYILKRDRSYANALAEAIIHAKEKTGFCRTCFTFADAELCRICSNTQRNAHLICVVEKPAEIRVIEEAGVYRGTYHVLHGSLSPLDGIGPNELKISELLLRLQTSPHIIDELILATNPSVEGEATALYLMRLLKPLGIRITQLAHGLPMGGLLEYTDKQTIGKALANRMEMT